MNDEILHKINKLEKEINDINNKIDKIYELLNENIKNNCDKMWEHINFVEAVYDNVKNPLGFVCNKVNYYIGNKKTYNLEDK